MFFNTLVTLYVCGKYQGVSGQINEQENYTTYSLDFEHVTYRDIQQAIQPYLDQDDVQSIELYIYRGNHDHVGDEATTGYMLAYAKDENQKVQDFIKQAGLAGQITDVQDFLNSKQVAVGYLTKAYDLSTVWIQKQAYPVAFSFAVGEKELRYSLLPFQLVTERNLHIDHINVEFDSIANASDLDQKTQQFQQDFPEAQIYPPIEKDQLLEGMFLYQAILAVAVMVLSAANYAFMVVYYIQKRMPSLPVFYLCGCTRKGQVLLIASEILVLYLAQFALALVLFEFWLKHLVIQLEPYLVYSFDPQIYIVVFGIGLGLAVIMVLPILLEKLLKNHNWHRIPKRNELVQKTTSPNFGMDINKKTHNAKPKVAFGGLLYLGGKQTMSRLLLYMLVFAQLTVCFLAVQFTLFTANQTFDVLYAAGDTYQNTYAISLNVNAAQQYENNIMRDADEDMKLHEQFTDDFVAMHNIIIPQNVPDVYMAYWEKISQDDALRDAYVEYIELRWHNEMKKSGYQSPEMTLYQYTKQDPAIKSMHTVAKFHQNFYMADRYFFENLRMKTQNSTNMKNYHSTEDKLYAIAYPFTPPKKSTDPDLQPYQIGERIIQRWLDEDTGTFRDVEIEVVDAFLDPAYIPFTYQFNYLESIDYFEYGYMLYAGQSSSPELLILAPDNMMYMQNAYHTSRILTLVQLHDHLSAEEQEAFFTDLEMVGGNHIPLVTGYTAKQKSLWFFFRQHALILVLALITLWLSVCAVALLLTSSNMRTYSIFLLCGARRVEVLCLSTIPWVLSVIASGVLSFAILTVLDGIKVQSLSLSVFRYFNEYNIVATAVLFALVLLLAIAIPLIWMRKKTAVYALEKSSHHG